MEGRNLSPEARPRSAGRENHASQQPAASISRFISPLVGGEDLDKADSHHMGIVGGPTGQQPSYGFHDGPASTPPPHAVSADPLSTGAAGSAPIAADNGRTTNTADPSHADTLEQQRAQQDIPVTSNGPTRPPLSPNYTSQRTFRASSQTPGGAGAQLGGEGMIHGNGNGIPAGARSNPSSGPPSPSGKHIFAHHPPGFTEPSPAGAQVLGSGEDYHDYLPPRSGAVTPTGSSSGTAGGATGGQAATNTTTTPAQFCFPRLGTRKASSTSVHHHSPLAPLSASTNSSSVNLNHNNGSARPSSSAGVLSSSQHAFAGHPRDEANRGRGSLTTGHNSPSTGVTPEHSANPSRQSTRQHSQGPLFELKRFLNNHLPHSGNNSTSHTPRWGKSNAASKNGSPDHYASVPGTPGHMTPRASRNGGSTVLHSGNAGPFSMTAAHPESDHSAPTSKASTREHKSSSSHFKEHKERSHHFGSRSRRDSPPLGEDHAHLQKKYGKWDKVLGSGAGGTVRLVRRPKDQTVYAVKEFRQKRAGEHERDYQKKVTAEFCIG